ncbi:HNH endonuclease signature motif containing protein, partial [Cryobacterium sp. N21]|uniref:HNH endonuclease signature motif containing protein n=1 Tax=Cryobacterium sp. N21 TaxID=2048289 RepID=UPI0011250B34
VSQAAARDPKTPTMGGAAPTVMIHVNAADLNDGRGVGWIDGVEAPVSLRRVKETICSGGAQKVIVGDTGDVLYLGDTVRCFTPKQRAAITARDGGCIIPGCTIPARWTETHHVIPWQQHGRTDIDNGVLLCWFHHHTIDTSGWKIRMINSRPQVRGPTAALGPHPNLAPRPQPPRQHHQPRTTLAHLSLTALSTRVFRLHILKGPCFQAPTSPRARFRGCPTSFLALRREAPPARR